MAASNEENGHHYGSITQTNSHPDGILATGAERKPLVLENSDGETRACTTTTPLRRNKSFLEEKELLQDEVAGMTKLAIPVIFTYMLEMLPGIITIILVGRVDAADEEGSDRERGNNMSMQKLHLDAAALAVMFINVVALSPAFGILTALDTLCSQAHGAKQPQKMGTYSLTGLAVIFFVFLSSSFLIWNASPILVMLGQPIEVSYMTADFIRYMIPGVPFLYFYEIIRKVFQSRNEAMPMLIAGIVNNGVNIVLGYYLVHYTEWGWMGAALARTAGNIVLVPTVLMMVLGGARKSDDCTDLPKNWDSQHYLALGNLYGGNRNNKNGDEEDGGGRNENDAAFLHHLWEGFIIKEALSAKAIWEFLSIGFPGMLQVMFEWCAWEAIALLCGILPNREEAIIGIGANTIIMNVSSMCYMLYLGASVAGSVRVGNALGAGDVHRAEIASKITMLAGAIMALINVVLLLRFRRILPVLFTKDWDMATKAQHLLLVAAAFQLPDALNGAIQGIFRGSGRMALGATWNFVAYYIIGIPLGYVLGIKLGFGVEGLWWGMTAGLCTISIGCTMIVLRSNWTKLALEATSRLNQ